MPYRVLIIKLGALGDVLRTTPLLAALRAQYPDAHVTWVTEPSCLPLLAGNPNIQRLLALDNVACLPLQAEEFDLLLSIDKEPAAAALATLVKAKVKRGFGWSAQGAVCPLDEKADYAYRLGIDDELKFRQNQKTYQQITFEMCDLPHAGEEYQWEIPVEDLQTAKLWAKGTGLDRRRPTIGLNTGGGEKFAGKGWNEGHWHALIDQIQDLDANIVLLGGPREVEMNAGFFRRHSGKGSMHNSGNNNSVGEFGGIVDLCDLVVTGDTFGMHVAIARKKKAVVLFGSTCHQEIELYGRGIKLYPTDLPCSPCYKKKCDYTSHEDCLRRIAPEQVLRSIQELLPLQPVKREAQKPGNPRRQRDVEPAEAIAEAHEREFDKSPAPAQGGENPPVQRQGSGRHEGRRGRENRWRRFRGRSFSGSGNANNRQPIP